MHLWSWKYCIRTLKLVHMWCVLSSSPTYISDRCNCMISTMHTHITQGSLNMQYGGTLHSQSKTVIIIITYVVCCLAAASATKMLLAACWLYTLHFARYTHQRLKKRKHNAVLLYSIVLLVMWYWGFLSLNIDLRMYALPRETQISSECYSVPFDSCVTSWLYILL